MRKIIGVSGFAGCGKDIFFRLLSELSGGQVVRFALADFLKEELKDFVQQNYNIDIFNCTRDQKNLIRTLLVFHGRMKRIQTLGRYWVDKLQKSIDSYPDQSKIGVITDIRYAEYKNDELFWLKNELKGILVHISKFRLDPEGRQIFDLPPNREEAGNDPHLLKQSDYKLFWEDCGGNYETLKTKYASKIEDFLKQHVN